MKFDFNLKIKSDTKNSTQKKQDVFALGQKISKIVFFVFLLLVVAASAFVWRKSLYNNGWTEEKKKEFVDSQSKSVTFNEKDFKKAADDFEARKKNEPAKNDSIRDIFK